MTFEKVRNDVFVNCNGDDYKRFQRSAKFRLDALCSARKFAVAQRLGTDGEIVFIGSFRTGPFANFEIDPDKVIKP